MRKLHFEYKMDLEFESPVGNHYYTLMGIPKNTFTQQIYSLEYDINPMECSYINKDVFENINLIGNIEKKHSYLKFYVSGIAFIGVNYKTQILNNIYRYSSKYTQYTKSIMEFCNDYESCNLENPFDRAIYLMNKLYNKLEYKKGVTNTNTSAGEALDLGCGVCQDYSHILIALCRYNNIPARYVVGFMVGEGATHAWVEVYCDGYWLQLDPTHNKIVDDSYIKVAHGRDYNDCIIDKGIFIGNTKQTQRVYVNVQDIT